VPASKPDSQVALLRSAPVARAFALEHCSSDCNWYHPVWQYFRALGIIKNAGGHTDFLRDSLVSHAPEAPRVLISGCADDAMTLLAIDAYREAGFPLDLTAVDVCESPLALSRWSAGERDARLTTRAIDILEFDAGTPYDLIMTTGFLGYIHPEKRSRLFARWASLLRPGGKLLFTNRLRPDAAETHYFSEEETRRYCALIRRRAEEARETIGVDPATIESWAREYAARFVGYPLRSVDDLHAHLRAAGFEADRIDSTRFPGTPGTENLAGPTSAGSSDFVRLLATRI